MKKLFGLFLTMGLFALIPTTSSAASVVGTITGTGKVPLKGATVIMTSLGNSDTTTTDTAGQYAFKRVSIGIKLVRASMAGYQNGQATATLTDSTSKDTVNIQLVARNNAVSSINGTVLDSVTKKPIANALVVAIHQGGGGFSVDSTRTNAKGVYVLDSLIVQTGYNVTATAAGYRNNNQRGIEVKLGVVTELNFNMVPSVLSIESQVEFAHSQQLIRISGRSLVDLGQSQLSRHIEVYGWNGVLRYSTLLPAGEAKLSLPAGLIHGDWLLRIRPLN